MSGFRFFFYSLEGSEPPHIHVEHGDNVAKFWLDHVSVAVSRGFRSHQLNGIRLLVIENRVKFLEAWNAHSAVKPDATAVDVRVTDDSLHVVLADGREVTVPLAWSPRLADATSEQRKNWRLIGRGQGIHWPDVDEDISVASLLKVA